jgi:protein TonB
MREPVVPDYPEPALRRGDEGTVHLRVRVLATGQAGEVRVQRSSGVAELDRAAVSAVQRSGFDPARDAAGDPTETWVIVPFRFVLRD